MTRRYNSNTRMEWELHKVGYTYYTIPGLTLPEVERLGRGAELEAEDIKAAQDKASRDARMKHG